MDPDPATSARLYAATRERVSTAVRKLDPSDLSRTVKACPEWTVHNLVSHLAGVATGFAAGNLDGAPRPPWTAVQVEARRSLPIDAVMEEWARSGPALEQVILAGTSDHPLVCNPWADAGTHEADLHGVLGIGRPPEELWMAALNWALPDPDPSDDVPGTLSIITLDGTYEIGTGSPVAVVRTSSYELFRAVFGRRSAEQIRSWTWSTPEYADAWSRELPRLPQTAEALLD
ncbi:MULTISPECIES: maleylpyruvate isomerase N-terminal domain-containing protein [unclassified Kribbella]|uniref:maleylpyruvate isomerase N-terminal domain-containing protein n=1 Tax=unclassified Kribbella TaxID=2644121 RepID=UPI003018B4A5